MTVAATLPRQWPSGAARECLDPGRAAAIASRPIATGSSGTAIGDGPASAETVVPPA